MQTPEQTPERIHLTRQQLLSGAAFDGPVSNQWFLPVGASEQVPCVSFSITFPETRMHCNHQDTAVIGRHIDLFPAAVLHLTSDGRNLVPFERGLVGDMDGNSYWSLVVSPGQIWMESSDGGWLRTALPFQLCNTLENDTHHGLATFVLKPDEISPVYFQIVAETKTFLCPDNLLAWGTLDAVVEAVEPGQSQPVVQAFRQEQQDEHPFKPLDHWLCGATEACFTDFKSGFGSDSTLIIGLVIDDQVHHSPCTTQYGDFPYPRALKFGIWSATKTAFCSIACLRLAQKFGTDPRRVRIASVLPEAAEFPHWREITIGQCLNMASGIGTAAPEPEPVDIFADYLLEAEQAETSALARKSYNHYRDWFLAPGQHEKNKAAFARPSYPWPADTIARYHDQDLYIAGAALDAWLKQQSGGDARIWNMVRDEVYGPVGIHHAVKFHTIETDPSKEVPLSDAGLLLTMDHIASLGKLIHDGGKIGNRQILATDMLAEWFDPVVQKGLPTGIRTTDGEVRYLGGIWRLPYVSGNNRRWWLPTMYGYGGQMIQILPNGTTAFRFGFDSYQTEERYDRLKLARLSDAIRPFGGR